MATKYFRIRYRLQSLETRTNPLFSNFKAYLIGDSTKRLISESEPIKDKKIVFEADLEESRSMAYDSQSRSYEEAIVTVMFEFEAESRFIKMGEAHINIADIINHSKNGQILPYKLEKCYDRNAKILFGVTFTQILAHQSIYQQSSQVLHSRSQCVLPQPRQKMKTTYQRNKMNTTDYSQITDRQDKEEELSISDKFHPNVSRTLNKTQILRKPQPKLQSNQEILDLKTENRIYLHQIAQIQLKCRQIQHEAEVLRQALSIYKKQNDQLSNQIEEFKKELAEKDQAKESLREQLNSEIGRLLKLYQESEQERNKLLLQREQQVSEENEKAKEGEKKLTAERNRLKSLERTEKTLIRKSQEYAAQITIYEKALKAQHRDKKKMTEAFEQANKTTGKLTQQRNSLKEERDRLKQTTQQLQSQLQLSRFSLEQYSKELLQIKRISKEHLDLIGRYQSELKVSSQAIKTQRCHFTRTIEEIEYQTELEQQTKQAYLEELEIKTINEQSKTNQISVLKRETSKLKHELSNQNELAEELQLQLKSLRKSYSQLQTKAGDYEVKLLQMSKQNTNLESELNHLKNEINQEEDQESRLSIIEHEREELIALCYQQRDEVWKMELEKLESDTRLLMEKTKREKDEQLQRYKKLYEENTSNSQNLKKIKAKLKETEDQKDSLRKINKEIQAKCVQLQRSINEKELDMSRNQIKISELQEKLLAAKQLEETLSECEKKSSTTKLEAESLKADLDKEKARQKKLRLDLKQLVNSAVTYIGKSQKHRIYYDQLRSDHIDAELLLIYNSATKLYCDRHNKVRAKLDQLEEMKSHLENKQRECQRINKSLKEQRRGSCDSNNSVNKSESQSTIRIMQAINAPITRTIVQKDEYELKNMRREVEELKSKLKKQANHYNQLQNQNEKYKHNLEQNYDDLRRAKEANELKQQLLCEAKEKLKIKEKQLQSSKQELRDMENEMQVMKKELDDLNRALKHEKSQVMKRSTVVSRSINNGRSEREQSTHRTLEIEKKLRSTQDELEKFKRQKDERKNETTQNRQLKSLQTRLKEKEQSIANLKQNLEEQREKTEQLKELQSLKIRKLKQEFQSQIQEKVRIEKELSQSLGESQQKLRQLHKKLKLLEENLKTTNSQLLSSSQREQKNKRMVITQWQIKIKTLQGEHQTQLNTLSKNIDEVKFAERSAKQVERRKDREISELKLNLQKRQRSLTELSQRLQLYGIRLKNMQQEESNYKEVIGVLQSKMKAQSSQQKKLQKECQRDTLDNRSNFSIKTFTFR